MCTTSMGLLRIYLRICNAQSLIFLLLNFMFLCGACIFMIRETIFIGSAERPPNTLCQHNTNHETQHLAENFPTHKQTNGIRVLTDPGCLIKIMIIAPGTNTNNNSTGEDLFPV